MQKLARKLKRGATAIAVTAGLACAALPAQAVIYQGDWDPSFGPAFPDLGWRGEASFFIPDACTELSGLVFNLGACSGMKILEAEVEFYKLSDPTKSTIDTLTFDIPSDLVVAATLDDGQLLGVLGAFLYSRPSTSPIAGGPFTEFTLLFQLDIARLAFYSDPPDGDPFFGISDKRPSDGTPFITFRRVPEPGPIALLSLALALLALTAGRPGRKRTSRAPA